MKDNKNNNLSGYWSGDYHYAGRGSATPFNLFIEDEAGDLSGTTLEPNTFADPTLEELTATISGARRGQDVTFRKLYDPAPGVHGEAVFYWGQVNEDFTVIEGEWSFRRARYPKGGFRLNRASGAAIQETVEVSASAKVEASASKRGGR